MEILTIILFLIYLYALGYLVVSFTKDEDSIHPIMKMGVGLGALPVLGVFLNFLHLPIDWRIFLGLSLLILWAKIKKDNGVRFIIETSRLQIDRNKISLCLFLIFSLVIYCWGPFRYPWLEDDDSWDHAAAIKYIATEKIFHASPGEFHYLNPYPPAYDIIFAVLHQTSPSLSWTLKFFNGLIIALSILLFYFFAKEFAQDKRRALLATFFLAMIPCYLSHFIWSHSLIVTLFFPAFYLILRTKKNPRFTIPASIVVAAIFMTQPTQSLKFIILIFFLWGIHCFYERKIWTAPVKILIIAGFISLLCWGQTFYKIFLGSQASKINTLISCGVGSVDKPTTFLSKLFDPRGGTATRAYTIEDYFFSPLHNMINNPTGVGMMLMILAMVGMIVMIRKILQKDEKKETRIYCGTILAWLVFTFLGMNSMTFHLPIGLFAFRFWMLFAIPVCLLAAEAFVVIQDLLKRKISLKIIIIVVILSSGYPKFSINTGIWPWGVEWKSKEELLSYLWMKTEIPLNSKVFAFTDNLFVIGHDMYADYWSTQYKHDFKDAINLPMTELYAALKKNNFDYLIIGRREIIKFGGEKVNAKLEEIFSDDKFHLLWGTEGAKLFEIF